MTKFKAIFLFSFFVIFFYTALVFWKAPSIESLSGCFETSMNHVQVCKGGKNFTPIGSISKFLIDSVIISEDASFYQHNGFDWFEIKESFLKNVDKMSLARGGSTISQQLAKNLFLTKDKTIMRKALEVYFTWQLEERLKKNQILELYFNVVEMGPNLYGISRASYFYFGKPPSDLDLFESAFIAHLLPNPKSYSKHYLRGTLSVFDKKRIRDIARKLLNFGKIDESQFNELESQISL